jgi:hypothetical protein
MNFSVLGMVLILTVGGLIILVGLTIDTLAGFLCRKTNYRNREWECESVLNLHKAVYGTTGFQLDAGDEVPHILVPLAHSSRATGEQPQQEQETQHMEVVEVAKENHTVTSNEVV